jgi:hypothetical protein
MRITKKKITVNGITRTVPLVKDGCSKTYVHAMKKRTMGGSILALLPRFETREEPNHEVKREQLFKRLAQRL